MTVISSTFDTDAEGWTSNKQTVTEWTPSGGNPDGYLHWQDVNATKHSVASYVAPKAFRGNLSDFAGGHLSFDLLDSGNDNSNKTGVVLVGRDGVELYAAMHAPGKDWTHYAFQLSSGDWRVGSPSGQVATEDQIADVLHHVKKIAIQADWGGKVDTGGLDNVMLVSGDEAARPVFGADQHGALPHLAAAHDTHLAGFVLA